VIHGLKYFRVVAAALFVWVVVAGMAGGVRPAGAAEEGGPLKPRRMAVLPWKVNAAEELGFVSDAMVEMLSSRIGSAGSFEMVRSGPLKDGPNDKAAAVVGKKLKLDYVLYGSLTVLGKTVSVDSRLLDVKSGKFSTFYAEGSGLDSVVSIADKLSGDVVTALRPVARAAAAAPGTGATAAAIPPAGGVKVMTGVTDGVGVGAPAPVTLPAATPSSGDPFIIKAEEGKPDFWKSARMKGDFVAFVATDLDRDGVKELFLVGRTGMTVAVIKDSKLKILKKLRAPAGVRYIGVLAFDSDRDGVEELYLSGVRGLSAHSSVVEFKDNRYMVTVTGIKWLLRTVTFRGEVQLVGQGFRESDGFYGGLRVLKRAGGKVTDSGPFELKLPRGADLYRFAYFEGFGPGGEPDLVVLDERGYLRVYKLKGAAWTQYWKSPEYYGGTLNYIESDEAGSGDTRLAPVAGAFFPADLDSDGRAELIIRRNVPGGIGRHVAKPGSFAKGSVMAIEWDGEFITEKWRTREVAGYIADFFIDDLDSDGTPEVVMLVVEKSSILSGSAKSYILSYELSL
jgi:TolB-like protein